MNALQGLVSLLGRVFLAAIFLGSAAMNHIPNFDGVVREMSSQGVPMPTVSHVLAIVFMLVGSILLIVGFYARIGAALLVVFLALACFYIHDFWTFEGEQAMQQQIHFMKNLSIMGGMLIVIANGPGAWSIDTHSTSPRPNESLPG